MVAITLAQVSPVRIRLGEDVLPIGLGEFTTAAAIASGQASTAAGAAATSASFAEEFSGPAYADTAAGVAATAVGQFFRVWNGDTPRTYARYERTGTTPFYVAASPLATTADLASTTSGASGSSRVKFESGQSAAVLTTAGPIYFSREYGIGGGDEATQVAAMITKHNAQRRTLVIDRSVSLSTLSLVNGYCSIESRGDGLLNITSGSAGLRARETFTAVGSWTAAPTLTRFPSANGSYISALTVDSASYAALSEGDYVHVSDSVWNRFQYVNGNGVLSNLTNLAETAQVIGKTGGNIVYLDRALAEWSLYSTSGTIAKLDFNPCRFDIAIGGEVSTTRDLLRLEGYVGADINARIEANSSRGVMLISCMGARVRAKVRDLRDDEGNSAFGYGVCAAAATTDCRIEVHARNVRHAYSDIIMGTADGLTQPATFNGGVARRITVTGEAISCSAASWDTHTCSDQIRYENITAWGTHNTTPGQPESGLNCAVQVRGTNVTIDGLETNLQFAVRYGVDAVRNTNLEINNLRHHNTIPNGASTTSINSLFSFSGTVFFGSGTHEVNIRNSRMHNLTYAGKDWNFVTVHNSDVNMATSTSAWPGMLFASGTASISGTTMTVTGTPTGFYGAEMLLTSGADPATRIVRQISGTTGGAGTYEVSISQTVASTTIAAAQTGVMTVYNNCRVRDPASMQIRAGLTFDGGKLIRSNFAGGFELMDRAVLKCRNHGIELLSSFSINNAAYAFSAISAGTATFEYANIWVSDQRAEYSIKPYAYTGTSGTQTITVKNIELLGFYKGVASRGDADTSLRVGRDKAFQRFPTTLTADRTVTLETIDADDGDSWEIWRPAGGAFNLLIKQGSTTLVTLATNGTARFFFELSSNNWRLSNKGSL